MSEISGSITFTFGDKINFLLEDTEGSVYTNTRPEYRREKMDFSPKILKLASYLFGCRVKGGV